MNRSRSAVAAILMAHLAGHAVAAEPDEVVPSAAEDYTLHCSACHTGDGSGTPGLVPSLRELAPLLDHPEGREYLIRVPGVAQAPLSDPRIARLLNWVLLEYSGLRVEPPFESAEVAGLRANPLRDPLAFRSRLPTGNE